MMRLRLEGRPNGKSSGGRAGKVVRSLSTLPRCKGSTSASREAPRVLSRHSSRSSPRRTYMSTPATSPRAGAAEFATDGARRSRVRRLSTETKAAFKTTEFFAYLAVVVGLLIAGNTVEGQEGGADYFAADKVWLYVTLLTIGYMISRGLAKAGSRDPYDDRDAR